jgi:hypothetical protein
LTACQNRCGKRYKFGVKFHELGVAMNERAIKLCEAFSISNATIWESEELHFE